MARRPSLRQLEYLLAVAEHRHFGEAAKRTAVSQPTLSLQLQALEDSLETKLVERNRNNVTLTPSGAIVAERAREILLQIDDLIAAVRQEQDNLGGLIRLGTAPTIGPYALPLVVPLLGAEFPALRIYIREELPARLVTLVANGNLDLALVALPSHDENLVSFEVAKERLLIGMASNHKLARLKTIPPEKLAGQKFLTLGRGHRLYEDVGRLAARHGAEVLQDYEGTSLDALRQMVALNMGLSVFPEHYAASEIAADKSVVLRPLKGEQLTRTLGFVWRRSSVRADDYVKLATIARRGL
ncbi:MAG: hydrogen peroxide-inducible genes activator [Filomicrobium sp.]